MPQPDPIPSPRRSQWQRFRRIMRWMSLASILSAAAAVYFVGEAAEHYLAEFSWIALLVVLLAVIGVSVRARLRRSPR